jgi:hypothetical protein
MKELEKLMKLEYYSISAQVHVMTNMAIGTLQKVVILEKQSTMALFTMPNN